MFVIRGGARYLLDAAERAWFLYSTETFGARDSCISSQTRGSFATPVPTRVAHYSYSLRTVYIQSTLQSTLKTIENSTVYIKKYKRLYRFISFLFI